MLEFSAPVKATGGDAAVISPAAIALVNKSKTATPVLDEICYKRLAGLSTKELLAEAGKQADAISASQGLPPRKYDYSRLSVSQMMTVRTNLVGNLGYTNEQTSGLLNLGLQKPDGGTSYGSPIDWTTPRNAVAEVTRGRDAAKSFGDLATARSYDLTLLAMRNSSVVDASNEPWFKTNTF